MEENRFVSLDVTVEDYVEGQQNKSTKEKTERDVRLLKKEDWDLADMASGRSL